MSLRSSRQPSSLFRDFAEASSINSQLVSHLASIWHSLWLVSTLQINDQLLKEPYFNSGFRVLLDMPSPVNVYFDTNQFPNNVFSWFNFAFNFGWLITLCLLEDISFTCYNLIFKCHCCLHSVNLLNRLEAKSIAEIEFEPAAYCCQMFI